MDAGFIGLGSMGAPIARRLAQCGFNVTGCDISPAMLEAFDEPGTHRSNDPMETARNSQMLGICVRTDAQLEQVINGGALFEALGDGGLVFLHSTVSPDLAREMDALAKKHGVGFIDVGVSGGGPAALKGELSLFVGGSDADVEKGRGWLEAIGKNIAHLGPVGRGQEAKLLNNLISIANYGMSVAIVDLATAMGFEREAFINALMAGSAQSFALRSAPGFVLPREGLGATGSFMGLHDLLKKDVEHAGHLTKAEPAAMAALLESCEAILSRIRRAAAEGEGRPGPKSPLETVDAYFNSIRAKDIDALMDLYADDAVFSMPNGNEFSGKDAIRAAQTAVFASGSPFPTPTRRLLTRDGCAVEVEAQLPDGSVRRTANLYSFDENCRITRLNVYAKQG